MIRWVLTLAVLGGLAIGAWSESVQLRAWLLQRSADRAYYRGDLETAIADSEAVRRLLPGNPQSHADLADTLSQALDGTPGEQMEADEFERLSARAAEYYLHAIRTGPARAWSYAGLGSLAATLRGARVQREEIDLSRLSPDPLENLRAEDRLYEAALVKAVSMEPRNYYYRDFLGEFYLRRGFQQRALEHIRAATRLHPVLNRHYYLGFLATISPAVLSAVEAGIQDALASSDTQVSAYDIHRFLADVYLRMGRLEEAKSSLNAAAEVSPQPHLVDIQIGQILAREGDDPAAAEAFRRSVERKPDYHRAWLHLGLALSRMDRHPEAVSAAKRARGLKPADFATLSALAGVLERAGDLDEATQVLEGLIRTHKDRDHLYLQLIRIYEAQDQVSQALQVARRLADRHPDEPAFQEQVQQLENSLRRNP